MASRSDFEDAMMYMADLIGGSRKKPYEVFYAGRHYGTYEREPSKGWAMPRGLPDGAYIYDPDKGVSKQWYRSDFTPVLPEDVPKELLAWILILN